MTDKHPITPPPDLVQQLWEKLRSNSDNDDYGPAIAWTHCIAEAAQWGADQELDACCTELDEINCQALEALPND